MTEVVCSEIPKFFSRRRIMDPDSLEGRMEREIHARYLSDLSASHIPTDGDLHAISELLDAAAVSVEGVKFLTYRVFRDFSKTCPVSLRGFFASSVFLAFPRDFDDRISLAAFYSFLIDSVSVCQSRISLSECDSLGTGFLSESQIDHYVRKSALPYLEAFLNSPSEASDFLPFFAITFARRAMIDLDPRCLGKISVHTLFHSPLFRNFQATLKHPPASSGNGGVDGNYALRLYQVYSSLDRDNDGMLSRRELGEFEGGTISSVVISRVFEEVQNFNKQFDYKGFLDFIMIMENKAKEVSMRYLFKILDIDGKGYLTRKDMVYLINAVISILFEKRQLNGLINPHDVTDEIFDMILPRKQISSICLEDLLSNKAGPLVVGMLVDANDFFHYENRENYLHSNNSQQ